MKWKRGDVLQTCVLVSPECKTGPFGRSGHVGKIAAFFPEKKICQVIFDDRLKGVYMATSLLVLKRPRNILNTLTEDKGLIAEDRLNLLEVYRLVKKRKFRSAFKMISDSQTLIDRCTEGFQQYLIYNSSNG